MLNTHWTRSSPTSSLLHPNKVILGETMLMPGVLIPCPLEQLEHPCPNLKQTAKSNRFTHYFAAKQVVATWSLMLASMQPSRKDATTLSLFSSLMVLIDHAPSRHKQLWVETNKYKA